MTDVFFHDDAEKLLTGLTESEVSAVRSVRASLELDPRLALQIGERMPGYDPAAEDYVLRLSPDDTGGHGISVLYRYVPTLDAVLIRWLIVGP